MGHCIRAIVGADSDLRKIAEDWVKADLTGLPQGCGMIFMTKALLEDVEELLEVSDDTCSPSLKILPRV